MVGSAPTHDLAAPEPSSRSWLTRAGVALSAFGLDRWLVGIFLLSRLLVVGAALAAEQFVARTPGFQPGAAGPLLSSLTSWDGFYYLDIVRHSYSAVPVAGEYMNIAFPPLYPILVQILAWPFAGGEGVVAVLVSNLAFLVALGLLVQLGTRYLGRERAVLAAGLLAIYPFAWVFAMSYTESLFLLLALAAFLAAETRQRPLAGVLLALAVLCRLQGVVLIVPLLILMLRQDGWKPKASLAWLLFGPAALAAFLGYVAMISGDLTGFAEAQQAWGRAGIGGASPDETIAADFSLYQAALLGTLLWSVFLLVFVRTDRMRVEYWSIPVLFLTVALLSGSLESIGRYSTLAFPYSWILANRRSRLARYAWPAISVFLFSVIAFLAFAGIWVP